MRHKKSYLSAVLAASLIFAYPISGQTEAHRPSLAVLDFGLSDFSRLAADKFASNLKSGSEISLLDRDQGRAAARGAGYSGSLNLSLKEASNLGAAIGSDFYLLGDAQTLRRSPSSGEVYFESYASIFLVSSRTGNLVTWKRLSFQAPQASLAEKNLLEELVKGDLRDHFLAVIHRQAADERQGRAMAVAKNTPVIESAPDEEKVAAEDGLRLPRPYRRLRPVYPESAARADAEAVVDVLVELDANGEVVRADVARWAGFGLDEATVSTVRQLRFFPAMRNGSPIPIRVLLRYNFRK